MNVPILNEIIRKYLTINSYFGKEAHKKLNDLAEFLHKFIIQIISRFAKIRTMITLYQIFDEVCFHSIESSYWQQQDVELIKKMERLPSIFRYLLEVSICSKGRTDGIDITRPDIVELVNYVNLLIDVCNYSDYLFYNDFKGGFEINEKGYIIFIKSDDMIKIESNIIDRLKTRRINIKRQAVFKENVKSYEELSQTYDSNFLNTYGVNLSTVCNIINCIYVHKYNDLSEVIFTQYNEIVKYVQRNTVYSKDDILICLKIFELNDKLLESNWGKYKFYDIPVSVSRRPIIRLSGSIGKKGMVIYGPNALLRSLALLFSYIDRGVIDIGLSLNSIYDKKGPEFEDIIINKFKKHNFKVMNYTHTPSNIGDIDAIAIHKKDNILYVIEAKSQKINLSMKKYKWQIKDTIKWSNQLDRKIKWVYNNIKKIELKLNVKGINNNKIKGMIIIRVPYYVKYNLPYDVLTIDELDKLLLKYV